MKTIKKLKQQYKIIKAETRIPSIDLFSLTLNHKNLYVAVFGPSISRNRISIELMPKRYRTSYRIDLKLMQERYFHSKKCSYITFNPTTTSESISISAYNLRRNTSPAFIKGGVVAGWIVITENGIFVNPPKNKRGNPIPNEKILKSYLNGVKPTKVNKGQIYIAPNSENLRDFGFADYDSFSLGVQDCKELLRGGLARILEHTEGEAKTLGKIASLYNKNADIKNHVIGKGSLPKLGSITFGVSEYIIIGEEYRRRLFASKTPPLEGLALSAALPHRPATLIT